MRISETSTSGRACWNASNAVRPESAVTTTAPHSTKYSRRASRTYSSSSTSSTRTPARGVACIAAPPGRLVRRIGADAGPLVLRQPGYLRSIPRPVALRPSLTTGLPLSERGPHMTKATGGPQSQIATATRTCAPVDEGPRRVPDQRWSADPTGFGSHLICSRPVKTLLAVLLAAAAVAPPSAAAQPLHLVLTPSQKPTDLLAAGEEF